jgi:hypothetical protein
MLWLFNSTPPSNHKCWKVQMHSFVVRGTSCHNYNSLMMSSPQRSIGSVAVKLHTFLTSSLDEDKWLAGCFNSGKWFLSIHLTRGLGRPQEKYPSPCQELNAGCSDHGQLLYWLAVVCPTVNNMNMEVMWASKVRTFNAATWNFG